MVGAISQVNMEYWSIEQSLAFGKLLIEDPVGWKGFKKMPEKLTIIEIGTILSHRTKEGMIEFTLNEEKTQWDIKKAKEICEMLHGAIEAAISDTLIFKFLTEKVGLDEDKAARALLDFREMRQGTRGTSYPV